MKMLSICIPTYEMNGQGRLFLRQSFDMMIEQTFTDFDVVISDHSQDDAIKNLCTEYQDKLSIQYYQNTEHRGSSSANINNAIAKATGTLLKILFQDDFLFHKDALKDIVTDFDTERDHWLITACTHTTDGKNFFNAYRPFYTKRIYIKNTIGSPSVLTIKNDGHLLFDETLVWLMDAEYYKRNYDAFGEPKVVGVVGVVSRIGEHQVTTTVATKTIRRTELLYVLKKYEHGFNFWFYSAFDYAKTIVRRIIGKVWKKYAVN